jgi:1-Cys peroxiredoxin 6
VCTTELAECHQLASTLKEKGVKMIGLSCDPVEQHKEWTKDVLAVTGKVNDTELAFPMIGDAKREIAASLGMLDPLEISDEGLPMPARALFIIGPDKTLKLAILYPATTGRNFAEVQRVVDSLFLTQDFSLATPVNWGFGDRLIVAPSVSSEVAAGKFKNLEIKDLPSKKPYLRYVDCPEMAFTKPGPVPATTANPQGSMDFRIKLGASFPDFNCCTTRGTFSFHAFLERSPSWTVFFSHPKDFTPVCTTELSECHNLAEKLKARGVKLIGLSCDSVELHKEWERDVLAVNGTTDKELGFPMIADPKREIAASLGMLDPQEVSSEGLPMPARALFVIGPDKKLRLSVLYPATTGRNFFEIVRCIDSLFLTQDFSLATPVNWKAGQRVIVAPAVSTETAKQKYANFEIKELPSQKPYLRYVDCPGDTGVRTNIGAMMTEAMYTPEASYQLPGGQATDADDKKDPTCTSIWCCSGA